MSSTAVPSGGANGATTWRAAFSERPAISRAAAGIGLHAAAFGVTFGAIAAGSGLGAMQAVAMSAVMFTGASQFALVGILAVGGSAVAAVSAALRLGVRNAFYGVAVARIVRPRGLRRLWTAHFIVDESAGPAALSLVTLVPPGVPIIAAAAVAIAAGPIPDRPRREAEER